MQISDAQFVHGDEQRNLRRCVLRLRLCLAVVKQNDRVGSVNHRLTEVDMVRQQSVAAARQREAAQTRREKHRRVFAQHPVICLVDTDSSNPDIARQQRQQAHVGCHMAALNHRVAMLVKHKQIVDGKTQRKLKRTLHTGNIKQRRQDKQHNGNGGNRSQYALCRLVPYNFLLYRLLLCLFTVCHQCLFFAEISQARMMP